MIPPEVYRVLVSMARTAGLAVPAASAPITDPSWVTFFTKLREHVS